MGDTGGRVLASTVGKERRFMGDQGHWLVRGHRILHSDPNPSMDMCLSFGDKIVNEIAIIHLNMDKPIASPYCNCSALYRAPSYDEVSGHP